MSAKVLDTVPLLYVARWYQKRDSKGRKKRFRKYLRVEGARAKWLADPTKAWGWDIEHATKAHKLADHYGADVVKISKGI